MQDTDFILWSNLDKLNFEDFKGNPNKIRDGEFVGHCETQYRFDHTIDVESKLPRFIIQNYFVKSKSFIREKGDTVTLRHEQVHFDLEEIFCRKTRRSWDSLYKMNVIKTLPYLSVKTKNRRQIDAVIRRFDSEQSSIPALEMGGSADKYIRKNLAEWEEKVQDEFGDLDAYKAN